ncbi:LuxR C-terminal-related transcriptional regulator [Agromyces aurantiacus]|uniref:LuxR C-terminal-related transcriptional regulator n=1 Tax=Agromyces aurantiacus TaxID=165814 RepID=A0ABV9R529_9MICO|nr:LuxR family transcriptional regulator [Agromyces aurantiacus]MBM7505734.1 DNA-binding CsgD family transcriptional regulator [Agromyces aurantiacus]
MALVPGGPADQPLALDESWPLVGRDPVIERALAGLRGSTRSVFAYGPSGIGKSRVVHAVAERLADDGWLVLTASGNPALSAVPLGALAPVLAREPASMVSAASDPVALYAAADAAVRRLADGRPVLLVVDDVSVVDSVSVTLIAQLAQSGRLRLAATVRESDPVPDGLHPVAASADALRLDVGPLDVDEVSELLTRVLGGPVAHRDAVELHRAAHGNPLFLRELAIGAAEAGSLVAVDGLWQLVGEPVGTPALRDLIRARLRVLGDDERDALERLALCEPLAFDEFARPGAAEALAALEMRGLIRVDESTARMRVALAHPHYAAAVRDQIPRIRAMSLLLEQADLVASRRMDAGDELRVAIWRLDAGRPSDPELLSRSAALAQLAHDRRTAERLAAAAVEAGADDAPTLLLHGEVLWSLGRAQDALATLTRADARARAEGAPDELLAAIGRARADVLGGDPLGTTRGLELLEALEAALPTQAAAIGLSKAVLLVNLEYGRDALETVEACAGSAAGAFERAVADLSFAMPLSLVGRGEEAVAAAQRAVDFAAAPGSVIPQRRAEIVLAHVLIAADRLEEARATVIESLHAAIRDDDELTARLDEFMMGRIFWQVGRLDTATRWFRDTISGAELHGPKSLREFALCFQAVVAAEQGDAATARALRARVVPGLERDSSATVLADAWIDAAEGSADAAAARIFARVDEVAPRGAVTVAATLLHHVVRFGSRTATAEAADRLAALSEQSDAPEVARRHAHARAEADGDAEGLRRSADEWERTGSLLFAAEASASAGQAARAAGRGREATADLQRAATLAAACEGARTPLLRFSDGAEPLTPREREIASLAAQGLSSNEIAARLYLSPRTVNNHLQSTYAKLGIRGRHELAV